MSKIFDLINELCPDGVEFKELGEIGYLYGGLSSKTKDDFVKHGNAKYITYMNVFLNLSIDTNALEYVKIDDNEKQNLVVYGDILFTGSSETRNECGFSSVFTKKIEEPIYLNSFCFGFRLNDLNLFDPEFLKYIFRSNFLRTQIIKTASGVTRFNVSKTKFLKIKLPVPPMEVQREIVCILDSFTLLTAELTAELTARKKQYEFYRDFLLSFDELDKNGGGCELKMLGEIAEIASGGTPSTHNKIFWEKGTIPWLKSEVCKDCIIEKSSLFITESGLDNSSAKIFKKGTVLMAMVGATIFKMAFLNIEAATNQNIAGIKANNKILMDKFLFYFLVKSYPELISKLSGYNMVNLTQVKKIKIPVPSLQTQQKVVDILDKFDTLVNSITEGLPREIELRRKQYEHYRELLLNFKPKMTA
ncbi:restriction endonuclease subunit S [Campylobacter concisus]|uniref:restriction endonuclease subunit S n=1 Tax=Campylobacter concisus TaxID=199 RepID=UPI000D364618|nr:restriction endonuclease subunit S [Campylobacter concisus]QPH93851.1 restriction endonuclease subunit S [Campylobacter concisus]